RRGSIGLRRKASSEMMAAPAPSSMAPHTSEKAPATWHARLARSSRPAISRPSLPVGVKMTARISCAATARSGSRGILHHGRVAFKGRYPGEDAREVGEGLAYSDAALVKTQFAD